MRFFFWHGSTKNEEITISKKSIVWPLIALLTDVNNSDSLRDDFAPGTYDEIIRRYGQIINHKSEKFELVTRILHDYRNYSFSGTEKERTNSFLAQEWEKYIQDFQLPNIEDELLEQIIRVFSHPNVEGLEYRIERILRAVTISTE